MVKKYNNKRVLINVFFVRTHDNEITQRSLTRLTICLYKKCFAPVFGQNWHYFNIEFRRLAYGLDTHSQL